MRIGIGSLGDALCYGLKLRLKKRVLVGRTLLLQPKLSVRGTVSGDYRPGEYLGAWIRKNAADVAIHNRTDLPGRKQRAKKRRR